eukprot:jgi/Botrbrau1/16066/Bobra.7_2s0037.1
MPEVNLVERVEGPRKVWRVAFFSRLETRKGVKLFVDALQQLDVEQLDPRFEVLFIGASSEIDNQQSSIWLHEHMKQWRWRTRIFLDLSRDEALEAVREEGTLLVLCSLLENLPYVVAEAASLNIPFLTFDMGGTLELFDPSTAKDTVIKEPTAEALARRMQAVLQRGTLRTVALSDHVTTASRQWLRWHGHFAARLPAFIKEDEAIREELQKLPHTPVGEVRVLQLAQDSRAMDTWELVCRRSPASLPDDMDRPLLLLPDGYRLLPKPGLTKLMAELLYTNGVRQTDIGAFTFGVELPTGQVSFPTAPTWALYSGRRQDAYCFEDVPMVLQTRAFCMAFTAQARVIRRYRSWALAALLNQANLRTITYPLVAFRVSEFIPARGHMPCSPLLLHPTRAIAYAATAGNMFRDATAFLRMKEFFRSGKPLASLKQDFPNMQGHMGWSFGFVPTRFAADIVTTPPVLEPLHWIPERGVWSCQNRQLQYPYIKMGEIHPCDSARTICCGHKHAAVVVRLTSYFSLKMARILFSWEANPQCGDGSSLFIMLYREGSSHPPQMLVMDNIEVKAKEPGLSSRRQAELRLPMSAGDLMDFVVEPRGDMGCDGISLVLWEIWPE